MNEPNDTAPPGPGDEALARLADTLGQPPAGVLDAAKALFASMFAEGLVGTSDEDGEFEVDEARLDDEAGEA
ncbi:hypothetical protein GCM10009639_34320 [Kitasatospora putterlickiae]|uniref:Uncharacterized protein n=1 Tax=Kitasatospora putterlickiae TaxID=221725 RepID=A0ABN1Y3U4_9ACTN